MREKIFLLFFLSIPFYVERAAAFNLIFNDKDWLQQKDKHFVVYYKNAQDQADAQQILSKAEEYYNISTDRIGYSRYQLFWTWDERVKIVYFPDQKAFIKATGQAEWIKGVSLSHLSGVPLRLIISFKGQENFLSSVLPHEISHLIFHDFLGQEKKTPLWMDEGIAQLDEVRDDAQYKPIMGRLVMAGQSIPFGMLDSVSTWHKSDPMKASIFYAESLYIVDFLIKTYGNESFRELCRLVRDGMPWQTALMRAYAPGVDSLERLEEKWKDYMRQFIK